MQKEGFNSWTSWLIAVSTAIIYCVLVPPYRLGALYYVEVIDYYEVGRKEASLPFTMMGCIRCLSGPFYGILGQKFGLQRVTFAGCVLAAIGMGASIFVRSITALTITYGLVYGFGVAGSALLPCILREHFDSSATTLSNAVLNLGPCICAFAFAPLLVHLFPVYGLPGIFLLTAGIILNAIPFTILLHKPSKTKTCKSRCHDKNDLIESSNSIETPKNLPGKLDSESNRSETLTKKDILSSDKQNNLVPITTSFIEIKVSKCLKHNRKNCYCITHCSTHKNIENTCVSETRFSNNASILLDSCAGTNLKAHMKDSSLNHVDEDSSINSSSIIRTPESKNQQTLNNDSQYNENKKDQNISYSKKQNGDCSSLKAVKDPAFLILLVTQGFYAYAYHIIITTIIDYSRDKGIEQSKEVYILAIQPITELIGRLAFTWVTDKNYLSVSTFGMILYSALAISSVGITFSNNFLTMVIAIMIISISTSAMLTIFPGMSYAYIERDSQILSVSSIAVLHAPLSFTLSPLIGYFRENLGSYDGLFILAAVLSILSALMMLSLPPLAKAREKKKMKIQAAISHDSAFL